VTSSDLVRTGVTNAVKFTPANGRIEVRLERVESTARIVVSDTGEGIKKEFLTSIFDRFTQADASATRHHGALGIGLDRNRKAPPVRKKCDPGDRPDSICRGGQSAKASGLGLSGPPRQTFPAR
jgi:hypothetical protein